MTAHGVLVLSGPPCSGKSSVGRVLPAALAATGRDSLHLEVDALFALLLPQSDRNREDRMLAYDAAHLLAGMLVGRGRTVVLECTYARREQRLSLLDALAAAPGVPSVPPVPSVPLWVVELFVSPDEAVRRFRHRREATDLDEPSVRERAAAFPYVEDALRLTSADAAPDELARQVAVWLRDGPRPVRREAWAEAGRGWS